MATVGTYTLLVGDGNRPAIALGGDREWVLPSGAPEVGRLADHLVINRPDYRPVVLSAGPNGIIETPFDVNGALANGDDLYALVTGGR